MDHSLTTGFKPGMGIPVWSPSLTPYSEPEYIGALLGLFILSVGFRGLVAAQGYLEAYLRLRFYPQTCHLHSHHMDDSPNQRPCDAPMKDPMHDTIDAIEPLLPLPSSSLDRTFILQPRQQSQPLHNIPQIHQQPQLHRSQRVVSSSSWSNALPQIPPFIWQAEVLRALLTTIVVGVGYMLMLVVMTYNSAYLAVILTGVFVGD
ncbi:hypothetical protein BGZ94_007105, partial [Podila epigama]